MKHLLLILLFTLPLSSCFFDPSGQVENPYIERLCDDGLDNDGDGFGDCEDQDCCESESCQGAPVCDSQE